MCVCACVCVFSKSSFPHTEPQRISGCTLYELQATVQTGKESNYSVSSRQLAYLYDRLCFRCVRPKWPNLYHTLSAAIYSQGFLFPITLFLMFFCLCWQELSNDQGSSNPSWPREKRHSPFQSCHNLLNFLP